MSSPRIAPSRRHLPLTLALAAGIVLAVGLVGPASLSAAGAYPNAMASTGDSITRAYNTGFFPFTDNPAASWSTGTSSSVTSHYLRLVALNPSIKGKNYNDAKSGALMIDLPGQVTTVNSQHVGYVTILMGGNDVCQPSEAAMTPVATFASEFSGAMSTLATGSPNARVFVASLPDVYRLWAILKDNSNARFVWSVFGVCQSMLANPLSTAQADVDRRTRVRQREIDYNTQLAQICAAFSQCRFDGNAVFGTQFVASDVSTRDYFHPSVAGQAKLAAGTWAVSYWGP